MITLPGATGQGLKVDPASPSFPWIDIEGTEIPDPSGGAAPTVEVFIGGQIKGRAYAAGDKLYIFFHYPHEIALGTDVHLHIHWAHNGTAISGNAVFTAYYSHAKGHNHANYNAEKSQTITYDTVNIATTPQYRHRIDEIVITDATGSGNYLDRDDIEPDGLLKVCVVMTTIPTITGGSTPKVFIDRVDMHAQTTGQGTKNKSPPFYSTV